MAGPIKIMIVAGEDSGDSHAANLVDSLRSELDRNDISFFGATGGKLREKGVKTIVRSDDFGIFGVAEVARAVPMFIGVMKRLVDAAVEKKPDLIVLVDFPEFNLKLAKKLKRRGFKVVYYISPQLWAWRGYRVRGIRKYVDLLLTILPFEGDWYEERGVEHVRFVGHPLVGKVVPSVGKQAFYQQNNLDPSKPLVALLPGSRGKEIEKIFPEMADCAGQFKQDRPGVQFAVGLARSRSKAELESVAGLENIDVVTEDTYSLLNAADAAVVTSGTATLETALIGTPQIIVYRTTNLSFSLLRPLVSLESVGLANLIAGRRVFTELIQNDLNADALCKELARILKPAINKELRDQSLKIRNSLGEADASIAAARAIVDFAGWRSK